MFTFIIAFIIGFGIGFIIGAAWQYTMTKNKEIDELIKKELS